VVQPLAFISLAIVSSGIFVIAPESRKIAIYGVYVGCRRVRKGGKYDSEVFFDLSEVLHGFDDHGFSVNVIDCVRKNGCFGN
jgi:hypothetical protein